MERSLFATNAADLRDVALRSPALSALLFAGTAIIGCGMALE